MLIPDNIHPESTIYFNGALVLQVVQEFRAKPLLDLYLAAHQIRAMSMPVFLLCLDWLFLLNLVRMNDRGEVELCS